MAILMAEMTRRFADRYIIIDTPPCMASSDAAALAPVVGQIVFIVEAHHTQQVKIEASLSMLSACPRISCCSIKAIRLRANILVLTSIIIFPRS
jgi:protein-tyrosine kinase